MDIPDYTRRELLAELYLRDLSAGSTTLVSRSPTTGKANATFLPAAATQASTIAMSADGKFITFNGKQGLTGGQSSFDRYLYVYEVATGHFTVASHAPDGSPLNPASNGGPTISADGRYIGFTGANGFVTGVTLNAQAQNGTPYIYDRLADTTVAVATDAAGTTAFGSLFGTDTTPLLSADGKKVTFSNSFAVGGLTDTNNTVDVYLNDVPVGTPLVAQPVVTVASGQANPTTQSPVLFKVAFNAPVTGFDASDISFAGSTVGGTLVTAVTGDGRSFTVTVTGMTGSGDVAVSIPAGAALAPNGSSSLASGTAVKVQFTSVAGSGPTVNIARAAGQVEPATGDVAFTVTFGEAVTGFDVNDLDLSGSTVGGTLAAAISGTGPVYTVTVSGATGSGNVSVSVKANAVTNAGGNPNTASTPATVAFDDTPPQVPPIAFAFGQSNGSVRLVSDTGTVVVSDFRPLDVGTPYNGLVQVALGDFNGDAVPDLLVAAANPSGVAGLNAAKAGQVFVYDGATLAKGTSPATPFRTFTPFANTDGPAGTSGAFINGLNIATGDVNGDGTTDLIAGSRGGTLAGGLIEYGRLVVISGSSPAGTNEVVGGIQKPFGPAYQKGVVVAAGNADGVGGAEVAVTRGGPVASPNPAVQQIKVKVLQLQGTTLTELKLAADGSTAFAPFAGLTGAAKAINRDGRVAFVDSDGDGKAELVFSALDPLTNPVNGQVRVGVYSINAATPSGGATLVSTGADSGTYLIGQGVVDHAISHVAATGTQQNLALVTESSSPGIVYLAPLTGATQAGGFALSILHGGITIDGI